MDSMNDIPSPRKRPGPKPPSNDLTPRELEVLTVLVEGHSNKIIGVHLDISEHTAKFHVDNIIKKMGFSGVGARVAVAVTAIRKGLVS